MKSNLFAAGALMMYGSYAATANTTSPRYVLPEVPLVQNVHPIFTVGDVVGGYRMVGIPDGMGVRAAGKNAFTLYVNHELTQANGVVRAHGSKGAFVSEWLMQPTLGANNAIAVDVQSGADSILTIQDWDDVNGGYYTVVPSTNPLRGAFSRFCAAYLAGPHDGFDAWMFLTGEETGGTDTMDGVQGGQAFAVIDDVAHALPRLGRFSHENQVVVPGTGMKTLVIGLEDGSGLDSQLYFTVGTKVPASADVLERNGLSNGDLYVMRVQGITTEDQFTTVGLAIPFTMQPVNWALTGSALETASDAASATGFARIEDGEYDPNNYADFYFDTTGNGTLGSPLRNGRLYRLTFNDLSNPVAGGTITMLLDGSEGMVSPDNLGINAHGQMLINEDPNYTLVGRDASIWLYDIPTGNFNRVVEMDTALAQSLDPAYTNGKWETSGVIDASSVIGEGVRR